MKHRRRISKVKLRHQKQFLFRCIIGCIGLILFLVGSSMLSGMDIWTIHDVRVNGVQTLKSNTIEQNVRSYLEGTYIGLYSKRNAFLYPKDRIQHDMKKAFPRIKKIDLSLHSLTTLGVYVTERMPFARWCPDVHNESKRVYNTCYFIDDTGVVFISDETPARTTEITFFGPRTGSSTVSTYTASSTVAPSISYTYNNTQISSSTDTDILGKQYKPAVFDELHAFIEYIKGFDLRARNVYSYPDNDYMITLKDGGFLFISLHQSIQETMANLGTVLSNKDLNLVRDSQTKNSFTKIDLRFGNRVFYTKATSTDVSH